MLVDIGKKLNLKICRCQCTYIYIMWDQRGGEGSGSLTLFVQSLISLLRFTFHYLLWKRFYSQKKTNQIRQMAIQFFWELLIHNTLPSFKYIDVFPNLSNTWATENQYPFCIQEFIVAVSPPRGTTHPANGRWYLKLCIHWAKR